MSKNNFLKNILTTASTMAVLIAGAQSASAVDYTTQGANNPVSFSVAGDWVNGPVVDGAGNTVELTRAVDIKADVATSAGGIELRLTDKNGQTMAIHESTKLTNITNAGGGEKIKFNMAAAKLLKIQAGGENVESVEFIAAGGFVCFEAATVTDMVVTNSTGAETGTVKFNYAAGPSTVNGQLGTEGTGALAIVRFVGDANINEKIYAQLVEGKAGKTLTVADNIIITTGNIKGADTAILALGDGSKIVGNVGDGAGQKFATATVGNVTTAGNMTIDAITINDDKVFTIGGNHTITGTIDSDTAIKGTLAFTADGEVTGNVGIGSKIKAINVNGAGAKIGGTVDAATFSVAAAGGIEVADAMTIDTLALIGALTAKNNVTVTNAVTLTDNAAAKFVVADNLIFKAPSVKVAGANAAGISIPGAHTVTVDSIAIGTEDNLMPVALGDAAATFKIIQDNTDAHLKFTNNDKEGVLDVLAQNANILAKSIDKNKSLNSFILSNAAKDQHITFKKDTYVNLGTVALDANGKNHKVTIDGTGGEAEVYAAFINAVAGTGSLELKEKVILRSVDAAGAGNITDANVTIALDNTNTLISEGGNFLGNITVAADSNPVTAAHARPTTFAKLTLADNSAQLVSDEANLTVTEFAGVGTKLAKVTLKTDTSSANVDLRNIDEIVELDYSGNNGTLTLTTRPIPIGPAPAQAILLDMSTVKNDVGKGKIKVKVNYRDDTLRLTSFGTTNALDSIDLIDDSTLEVGEGETLSTVNGITSTGAGDAVFTLLNDAKYIGDVKNSVSSVFLRKRSTLIGDVATANTLSLQESSSITGNVNVANFLELENDAFITGDVTSEIRFSKNGASAKIIGAVAGDVVMNKTNTEFTVDGSYTGTVTTTVTDDQTFILKGGATAASNITLAGDKALATLSVEGSKGISLTKGAGTAPAAFEIHGATQLTLADADALAATTITVDNAGHKIITAQNQALGGATHLVGRASNQANIHLTGNNIITLTGNSVAHHMNVTTANTNQGTLKFAAGNVELQGNLGTADSKMAAVDFSDGSKYSGTAYATKFGHEAGATVTLTDATLVGEYVFAGAGNLHMTDAVVGPIDASAAGVQNIYVSAASKAGGAWGAAGSKVDLVEVKTGGSLDMDTFGLHFKNIKVNADSKVYLGTDHTLTGADIAANGCINTGIHTLTVDGGNSYVDGSAFAIGISADDDGVVTHGRIIFNNAAAADFADNTITLVAEHVPSSESYVAGSLDLTDASTFIFADGMSDENKDKITAAFGNRTELAYATYTPEGAESSIVTGLSASDVVQAQEILKLADEAGIELPFAAGSAEALEFAGELVAETAVPDAVTAAVTGATSAAGGAVGTRFDISTSVTPGAGAPAMSSGDNPLAYGAWVNAMGSSATQKSDNKTPIGYKSKLAGGTIGWDAEVAEGAMLGLAATYVKGDVKLKDEKVGDKADITTMMLNLYGQKMLPNNMFIQAVLGYAQTDVKVKAQRFVAANTYDVASSKYKVKGYAASVLGGYSMAIDENVKLTPMVGMKFGKMNQGNVTETGSAQNLAISVKHKDNITGVVGARLEKKVVNSDMMFIPEAHAFVDYNLGSKKAATHKVGLANQTAKITQTVENSSKYSINLGTSVTARSGMMEYSVGYDATIAKKYVGHQGTLKVRVNL